MQPETLRARLGGASLLGLTASVPLCALATGTSLSCDPAELAGASVLIRTEDQLSAALALIELDGIAARMVIAPPDLKSEHLPSVIARAEIDTLVTDRAELGVANLCTVRVAPTTRPLSVVPAATQRSEWVMFTSGTTGAPKMVAHSLEALTGAIVPGANPERIVWSTFYDIRRYGGLQILLRALIGQTPLVLSDAHEAVGDFLARLAGEGVTHLTGTPSHWRRALMSPAIARIAPRYVRLSGEIADQAILDALKAQFPRAAIGHAYASTEAGVCFEVTDGLAGFPSATLDRPGDVEMQIEDDTLRVRSPRTATRYVGSKDCLKYNGFVDTGDLIAQRGDGRCYFLGRRGGIINVGGLKFSPEEVEAVLNRHPGVRSSRVSGRRSPITGAVVVAEIVPTLPANDNKTFRDEVLNFCREQLAPAQVPALLRIVSSLELTAGGKLARPSDA